MSLSGFRCAFIDSLKNKLLDITLMGNPNHTSDLRSLVSRLVRSTPSDGQSIMNELKIFSNQALEFLVVLQRSRKLITDQFIYGDRTIIDDPFVNRYILGLSTPYNNLDSHYQMLRCIHAKGAHVDMMTLVLAVLTPTAYLRGSNVTIELVTKHPDYSVKGTAYINGTVSFTFGSNTPVIVGTGNKFDINMGAICTVTNGIAAEDFVLVPAQNQKKRNTNNTPTGTSPNGPNGLNIAEYHATVGAAGCHQAAKEDARRIPPTAAPPRGSFLQGETAVSDHPQPPPATESRICRRSPTAKRLSTKGAPIVVDVDTTRISLAKGPASQRRKVRGTKALKEPTPLANGPTLRCRKAEDNRAAVGHSTNGRRVPCHDGSTLSQNHSTLLCSGNRLCAITNQVTVRQEDGSYVVKLPTRPEFPTELQRG
uniref:Uncharacterized protein n=1 Tax=Glossina austeni TaxID=7395 RepID=A0A1A9VXQ1_GLOAU